MFVAPIIGPPVQARILIVEDEGPIAHNVATRLCQSGYNHRNRPPDCRRSDAKAGGYEVRKELLPQRKEVKIFLTSAYTADVLERREGKPLGTRLLSKPCSNKDFLGQVATLLKQKPAPIVELIV